MSDVIVNKFVLETSLIDDRNYRFFKLDNGLKVIVISSLKPGESVEVYSSSSDDNDDDESVSDLCEGGEMDTIKKEEIKSAAALCINVGSFSDPPEAQGLSHFLEHMVFMGSEKFPTENDFDSYVSQCGGSMNAWTANERTLFYFDSTQKHFVKCFDRFAQFFIAPLLNRDSVDREITAVNSEYELAYSRDSSRVHHFIASLSRPDSPYHSFGYGNLKSLKDIPENNGTDIYTLLRNHWQSRYSSHHMTLAVISKNTLDEMEQTVRETCSAIKDSRVPSPDYSKFWDSFDTPTFNRLYRVCPLSSLELLHIVWTLPMLQYAYESCPLGIISSLIGHEGAGSILALLREKNLAVALSCGIDPGSDFEHSSICTIFIIKITLTDKGVERLYEVCHIVFDYTRMLFDRAGASLSMSDNAPNGQSCGSNGDQRDSSERVVHTLTSYVSEYAQTHKASFDYLDPSDPVDTVETVANMMQLVPPEVIFSAFHLLKQPDMRLYFETLKHFGSENAAIISLSSKFANSVDDSSKWEVEPWFNIRYLSEGIPFTVSEQWMTSPPRPELHLPFKNIFLTTDFKLLSPDSPMKVPVRVTDIAHANCGELWYQLSNKFKAPKAVVHVHFWSKVVTDSPENIALHALLVYSLRQSLDSIAYEGSEANLDYGLEFIESGIKLSVNGFNQKLFTFYRAILEHILNFDRPISPAHFESYREAVRRSYFNHSLKPNALNTHLQGYILRKDNHLLDSILISLRDVTVADLLAHRQRFFARTYITTYAYGNLSLESAKNFAQYTISAIKPAAVIKRTFSDSAILSPGTHWLRVLNCNPTDVNTCVCQVHLLGMSDLTMDTYNRLLSYVLSEPAFDFLRTKETLGYAVNLRSWHSNPGGNMHVGMMLTACSQANKHKTSHVAGCLDAFWYRIAPRYLATLLPKVFDTARNSLIAMCRLLDDNMMKEIQRNWSEILTFDRTFDRREQIAKILGSATKQELFKFYMDHYLTPSKRRTLVIEVDAPAEPNRDAKIPPNSYFVSFKHVSPDETLLIEERASCDKVNIDQILRSWSSTCSSDDADCLKILREYGAQVLDNECRAIVDRPMIIENVRKFRNELTFEPVNIDGSRASNK